MFLFSYACERRRTASGMREKGEGGWSALARTRLGHKAEEECQVDHESMTGSRKVGSRQPEGRRTVYCASCTASGLEERERERERQVYGVCTVCRMGVTHSFVVGYLAIPCSSSCTQEERRMADGGYGMRGCLVASDWLM